MQKLDLSSWSPVCSSYLKWNVSFRKKKLIIKSLNDHVCTIVYFYFKSFFWNLNTSSRVEKAESPVGQSSLQVHTSRCNQYPVFLIKGGEKEWEDWVTTSTFMSQAVLVLGDMTIYWLLQQRLNKFSEENHPQGTELGIETFKQVDLRRRKILTLRKTVIKVRTRISSSRKLTNQIIHNKVKKKKI